MALADDIAALPTTPVPGQVGHDNNHGTAHQALQAHQLAIAGLARIISLNAYGAKGDGTDHTAVFNAAIAYANTLLGNDRANVHGVTFIIPDGFYALPTPLNPITVSGVQFKGQSEQSTVFRVSAAGSLFTIGDATRTRLAVGVGISNLKIEYTSAPAATDTFATLAYCADFRLTDIQCILVPNLLTLGTSPTLYASGITVDRVKGSAANVGAPLFRMNNGAGLTVNNTEMFVSGIATPVHPANMTTAANTAAFAGPSTGTNSWDTLQISNSLFERFDTGIIGVAPSGGVFQNVFVSNTIFDYTRRYAVYLESQTGGVISNFRSDKNCWFVSWETDAIVLTGAGYHDYHEVGGIVTIAGVGALNYALPNAKNVVVELSLGAIGQKSAAPGALYFAPNSTGFTVKDCTGNDDNTSIGLPWRNDWGLTVGANCDNYLVTGNRLTGGAGGGYNTFAVNTAASTKRRMTNNVGTGYAGYGGAFTVAATTVANVNTSPQVWEVNIYGGTVTAIAKNGTAIAGMVAGTLRIEPGESFTVTYSVAPTVTQFVLP